MFEAFVDPSVTSRFWFSEGSGRRKSGKRITWTWRRYDFSVDADVRAVEPNERIVVEWPGYGDPPPIEWILTDRPDSTTFVKITNTGLQDSSEEVVQMAVDATEGFSFVLAGAKAWLVHGKQVSPKRERRSLGLAIAA